MREWPQHLQPRYPSAVFVDRDGTITVDNHYPHRAEELAFLPRSLLALQALGKLPVHIIVISNQAGIALGLFTEADMCRYNARLRREVEGAGGRIDALYYCPDKEPKNLLPGEAPSPCAKPAPGMLLEAAGEFGIDLEQSFMIGDRLSDIAAGKTAGCHTYLVKTGKGGRDPEEEVVVEPDHTAADLFAAVQDIAARSMSLASRQPFAKG